MTMVLIKVIVIKSFDRIRLNHNPDVFIKKVYRTRLYRSLFAHQGCFYLLKYDNIVIDKELVRADGKDWLRDYRNALASTLRV